MESEEIKLAKCINELSLMHKKFTEMGGDIMMANNRALYTTDFLALAVINRSIALVEGFVTLVNVNNYLCAIPLIRLQLDNALRFFAISLVTDGNDFFLHFMNGKPINRYKSVTGDYLSDNYLAKKLDTVFPGVLKLYTNISSHIHLSDQHVYATKDLNKNELKRTKIRFGKDVDAFSLELKIQFAFSMLEVGKLVLLNLHRWKHLKQNLPEINPDDMRSIII